MSNPFRDDHEAQLARAEADPHYAPYCMRCPGLLRMRKIELHYWRCGCGAQSGQLHSRQADPRRDPGLTAND